MRYGILSDIHANLEALEAVCEACGKERIDSYVCLGDFVGYGADPDECIKRTAAVSSVSVAGNHDRGAVGMFPYKSFNPCAREALLRTETCLSSDNRAFLACLKLLYEDLDMTLVHGTLEHPEDFDYLTDEYSAGRNMRLQRTDILFVGHTHIAAIFCRDASGTVLQISGRSIPVKKNWKYIVNAGSVGQPRDRDPRAAYCVYDSDEKTIEIKRVEYDAEKARKKIIEAGLPQVLGDRLLSGR